MPDNRTTLCRICKRPKHTDTEPCHPGEDGQCHGGESCYREAWETRTRYDGRRVEALTRIAESTMDDIMYKSIGMMHAHPEECESIWLQMTELMAEDRKRLRTEMELLVCRTPMPPVYFDVMNVAQSLMDKMHVPKDVLRTPGEVYFMDFFKSWWRRLTRRLGMD